MSGSRTMIAAVLAFLLASNLLSADREEVLASAVSASDRLAEVKDFDRSWHDATYLVGNALLWEQLSADSADTGWHLWNRVDAIIGSGRATVLHGDDAAYAQGAFDLYRLAPPDDLAFRASRLAATGGALDFAHLVMEHTAEDGDPIAGLWRDAGIGYGCRYWQDDVFMMIPWLAMRGSSRDGLPGEESTRNLAYEWVEAYAFDHRKGVDGVADSRVPTMSRRRLEGWTRGDSRSGRLLYDPQSGLWWHDEDDPGKVEYWSRGNGWVAAALVRAQRYLDAPYSGGRYERWLDRSELRRMITGMASRLVTERNTYGLWNADIVRRQDFTVPESSGSALFTFMLAQGLNEGWLDEQVYGPAALKAYHALSRMVDSDGDLHHIQRAAAGPGTREFHASDHEDLNLNYGVGALLMAAAEVARLPAAWLAEIESTDAIVLARDGFELDGGELVVEAAGLGDFGAAVADGAAVAALSEQLFLDARYELETRLIRVENAGHGDIALFVDAGVDELSAGHGYLIPAVARADGIAGTVWRSDVVIRNPAPAATEARVSFRARGDGVHETSVQIPAGGSLVLADVLASLFSVEGVGSLVIESPDQLHLSSRTYTASDGGSFGQFIAAHERYQAITYGEEARLLLLGRNADRRTNVGCASFSTLETEVSFSFRSLDGRQVGQVRATVPPLGTFQRSEALAEVPDEDAAAVYAVARVLSPGGAVVPYASVVDGTTGDPSLVLSASPARSVMAESVAATSAIYVAASAHVDGANNSRWRTDLEVHNPGAETASFVVDLLAAGQENSNPASLAVEALEPGSSVRWHDVIGEGFGWTGAGALRITPTSGTLMVASRTYNQTPSGTYGQFIPGEPVFEALFYEEEAVLTHLSSSPTRALGERTNIGFVNTRAEPSRIEISLVDAAGDALGAIDVELEAFEYRQLTDVFNLVGAGPVAGCAAHLALTTPGARIFAYASVVDNVTGDPIYLPAVARQGGE